MTLRPDVVCTGRGDSGGHCCTINGSTCEFLTTVDEVPRCGLLIDLGSWEAVHSDRRFLEAPVGLWFAENHPGFGCGDWPQRIPGLLDRVASGELNPSSVCCWGVG